MLLNSLPTASAVFPSAFLSYPNASQAYQGGAQLLASGMLQSYLNTARKSAEETFSAKRCSIYNQDLAFETLVRLHQVGSLPAEMKRAVPVQPQPEVVRSPIRCWDVTGCLLAFMSVGCSSSSHGDTEGCFTSLLQVSDPPTQKPDTSESLSFSFGKIKSYNAVSSIVCVSA